jgi:hypothetical protein
MKIESGSWPGSGSRFFLGVSWANERHLFGVHWFVKNFNQWGYENIYYDGDHHSFGFGRLALFVWY